MKDTTQTFAEFLDKLTALSEKYAPHIYETALTVVQVKAISELLLSIVSLIAVFFFVRKVIKLHKQEFFDTYDEALIVMGIIIGCIIVATTVITSLFSLLNVWNWIAMFDPELALAGKILNI